MMTMGLLVIVVPLLYGLIGQGCFVLLYLLLTGVALQFYRCRGNIILSKIDGCVLIFLVYGFCNMLFVKANGVDCLFLLQWLLLLSVYVMARGVNDKKIVILYFITASGAVQALIGILQLMGVVGSGHFDFVLTGSFPNPGPYGGNLALSLISTVVGFTQTKLKIMKITTIVFSLLLFVMLLLSGSRAGLLALICGVIYFVFEKIHTKRKIVVGIGLVLFLVGVCTLLYFYRTGSADARLLLWRVCGDIFIDNSLVGVGVASLPSVYMDYQADYFANAPNSIFAEVANNNYQAFNEFIHITCEQGVIGFGLFLSILLFLFRSKGERSLKAIAVSLIVFSCFSYPADVLSLKMMFPLLIGFSTSNAIYRLKFRRWIIIVPLLFIPIVIYCNLFYKKAFLDIENTGSAMLPNNKNYMSQYAKINANVEILSYLTKNVISSSDILCDMGDAYAVIGDTISADSCYQRASNMVPNRILPLYNLFLLYNGRDQATIYAQRIVNFESKIINSLTLRAKSQSREYLNLIKNE